MTDDDRTYPDRDPLVEVRELEKHYYEQDTLLDRLFGHDPVAVRAVDGVSFDVYPGETLGIVGESGCGKSTCAETLMRLREPTDGTVRFDGDPVFELSGEELMEFRRRAQVMFQDPFSSLDPRMTAGEIIREPLESQGVGTDESRRERAAELLESVGLSADQADRYPHEFSGGQRQRIGFARAVALEPEFVVLDEPVSALDVSVQAQVLNLLADMQAELDLTYLFIAHDLSVVRHICDRVAVMYLGQLVEVGPTEEIFDDPNHPYTEALLESVPRADVEERSREVSALRGDVPSPRNPPSGCSFRTRCPSVIPPDGADLTQAAYREIMELRDRVERGDVDVDFYWEAVDDGTVADPTETDRSGADRTETAAFVRAAREDLLSHELSGRDDDVVEAALTSLAAEEYDAAAETLRERYESVCEVVEPTLTDDDHPVACHLEPQPESVVAAADAWHRGEDPSSPGGEGTVGGSRSGGSGSDGSVSDASDGTEPTAD